MDWSGWDDKTIVTTTIQVDRGGPAAVEGTLRPGDRIIAINGKGLGGVKLPELQVLRWWWWWCHNFDHFLLSGSSLSARQRDSVHSGVRHRKAGHHQLTKPTSIIMQRFTWELKSLALKQFSLIFWHSLLPLHFLNWAFPAKRSARKLGRARCGWEKRVLCYSFIFGRPAGTRMILFSIPPHVYKEYASKKRQIRKST